jgi:hypothetical protein
MRAVKLPITSAIHRKCTFKALFDHWLPRTVFPLTPAIRRLGLLRYGRNCHTSFTADWHYGDVPFRACTNINKSKHYTVIMAAGGNGLENWQERFFSLWALLSVMFPKYSIVFIPDGTQQLLFFRKASFCFP